MFYIKNIALGYVPVFFCEVYVYAIFIQVALHKLTDIFMGLNSVAAQPGKQGWLLVMVLVEAAEGPAQC